MVAASCISINANIAKTEVGIMKCGPVLLNLRLIAHQPMQKIIPPVDRELILGELTPERLLRISNKADNEIYVISAHTAPHTMREIGRLREMAFRGAGGGTGKECDIDQYDTMARPCRQLIVWDPKTREIIGGYRFILGEEMEIKDGQPNIATSHMFAFSERFLTEYLPNTLELGRSFVSPEYQHTRSNPKALYALDNLWDGLGALTVVYPQIKYLFGKVTMYPSFGAASRDLILGFLHHHFPDPDALVEPKHPLDTRARSAEIQKIFSKPTFRENYKTLNALIREQGKNIPPLVNAYMGLSPSMRMFGTAINPEFGDVEESGIFFDISTIFEEKKQRHIGTFRASPHTGRVTATANRK